jgi:hypothetical protein
MSNDSYIEKAWATPICNKYSFRGILSRRYNLTNKNFAEPGSSNQRQFRLAKEFFTGEFNSIKQDFDRVTVLWGITSTARNELYHLSKKELVTFFYNTDCPESRAMIEYFYDHDNEVRQLTTEMLFWNDYFTSKNIKNIWFDTFNHHDYYSPIKNLIPEDKNPRDLLSLLAIKNGLERPDNHYHHSAWSIDSNRIKHLINCGVLNPYSHHPSQLGHQQIADLLSPFVE